MNMFDKILLLSWVSTWIIFPFSSIMCEVTWNDTFWVILEVISGIILIGVPLVCIFYGILQM